MVDRRVSKGLVGRAEAPGFTLDSCAAFGIFVVENVELAEVPLEAISFISKS